MATPELLTDTSPDAMNANSPKPPTNAERRQARLEDELRANLLKRKTQARARRDDTAGSSGTEDKPVAAAASPLPGGPRSD